VSAYVALMDLRPNLSRYQQTGPVFYAVYSSSERGILGGSCRCPLLLCSLSCSWTHWMEKMPGSC